VHEGVEMRVVIRGLHQRGMAFDTRLVNVMMCVRAPVEIEASCLSGFFWGFFFVFHVNFIHASFRIPSAPKSILQMQL
jgi:hypothetical protein